METNDTTGGAAALTQALSDALWNGDIANVRRLLDEGADPNALARYGFTPLRAAATSGFAEAIGLLVERGASLHAPKQLPNDGSYLQNAAQSGSVEAVRLLVDAGLSVHERGSYGWTPLSAAAAQNRSFPAECNAAVIAELIRYGSDVNARDDKNRTPLHWAAQFAFVAAVPILVGAGADPSAVDDNGFTPLHYAFNVGEYPPGVTADLVGALLASGADVNAATPKGKITPLHVATYSHAPEPVLKQLLDAGADINARTRQGHTPLTEAMPDPKTFSLLLAAGADITSLVAAKGKPALLTATEAGNEAAVVALLAAGADPNDLYRGTTALHLAVWKAHAELVKRLLEAGADHQVPNKKGATALDLARKGRRKAILPQLEAAEVARVANVVP
jgi:ankyrin repeat protein